MSPPVPWRERLSGQALSLVALGMLLSALAAAGVVLFVVQTELGLVVRGLPPSARAAFERRWQDLQQGADPALDFDLPWFVLLAALLPLVALAGWTRWVHGRFVRPLRHASRAARELARGGWPEVVPGGTGGEAGQVQRDVQHLALELRRLHEEREATAAAIAHELRTPLAVLQARLQAHLDGVLPLDGPATGALLAQIGVLRRLVDDVQTLSLSQVGRLTLRPERLDVAAWVKGRLDAGTFGPAPVELAVEPDAAPLWVDADPERLAQVLGNLLHNAAVHAGPGGAVQVRVKPEGRYVCVQVLDRGPGFPEGAEGRVFERFYRADPSRSRHTGGSGLGLSVVRALVEAHGGEVHAENRPRGGARVTVRFPRTGDPHEA